MDPRIDEELKACCVGDVVINNVDKDIVETQKISKFEDDTIRLHLQTMIDSGVIPVMVVTGRSVEVFAVAPESIET